MARTAAGPPDEIGLDRLGDATTVLVLADRASDGDGRACQGLLSVGPAVPTDLLRVTYHGTPGATVDRWAAREDTRPADVRVVAVGEAAGLAERGAVERGTVERLDVETVRAPADLTAVGIAVTRALADWSGDGNRTVACFDSVTDLLAHVEFETAYRFLHILTRRLEAYGAVGHYHLDPAAHDERTVACVKGLFDAVVSPTSGGAVDVRTR